MSRSSGGRRPKFPEIRSIPSFSVQRDVKAKREEGVQRASFFFFAFSLSRQLTRELRAWTRLFKGECMRLHERETTCTSVQMVQRGERKEEGGIRTRETGRSAKGRLSYPERNGGIGFSGFQATRRANNLQGARTFFTSTAVEVARGDESAIAGRQVGRLTRCEWNFARKRIILREGIATVCDRIRALLRST